MRIMFKAMNFSEEEEDKVLGHLDAKNKSTFEKVRAYLIITK